jgi:3-phenylpropionate/trans-cinnamate dioxygenase ferredoxin subunit
MFNYRQPEHGPLEFVTVATAGELGNGERLALDIDGQAIVVFNIAGEYFAIADVCSHDEAPVGEGELSGLEIECPRHGARFDLRTGKALCLPAVVDIPAYPVRLTAGELQVGLPLDSPTQPR